MLENSYWNSNGKHQAVVEALQERVPYEGAVPDARGRNKALEKFRKASNCYYDLYNNGLCNRAAEFNRVFGVASSRYKEPWRGYGRYSEALYAATEVAMDSIIEAAALEQGLTLDKIVQDACVE